MAVRSDSGSVLMLVPAGFFVLIILSSIAVDSATAFMAQRELQNIAAGAANDAVTIAVPPEDLQAGVDPVPDARRADDYVRSSLVGYRVGRLVVGDDDINVQVNEQERSVTVQVGGRMPYIFARAVPGARDFVDVRAESTAVLRVRQAGDAGTP